jgi:hypothetical protein
VELSGAGAGWADISDDLASEAIVVKHGIAGASPADRVAGSGTASFFLKNDTTNSGHRLGYYSLHHVNKRSGWALNIGCRIRLLDPATNAWRTRFIGKVDAIAVQPWQYGQRRVEVTAVDWMDEAARWALVPEVGEQLNKRADQILTNILAQMPTQPTSTSFDEGRETYPYALDTSSSAKQPALSEFHKLAASEFGYIYLKANGTLRFEGRHTRILSSSSLWTIDDAALDASEDALDASSGRGDILNTVRVTTHPKIVDVAATTVVYHQANVIRVTAGETKTLLGEFRDPVTGDAIGATEIQGINGSNQMTAAGTDYVANTAESGGGTDVTASFTITVAIGQSGVRFSALNSGSSDAYLTTLQLRGKGVYDRGSFDSQARNSSSVTTYGERVALFDMPYQSKIEVGQGAADYILGNEAVEVARARTVRVMGRDPFTLSQILARDIGDRITVQETVTGFNNSYFINGIELTILPAGYVQAMYTLVRLNQASYWILGTSILGTDTVPAPF